MSFNVAKAETVTALEATVATKVDKLGVTTTNRPSASTSGVGAMIFDLTLNKPIWSNGTVWVDATGTAV